MGQRWFDGYSADVEIYLVIDDKRYEVAQIGSGSLILRDFREIPPCTHAKLIMNIDGNEEAEDVFLGDGAKGNEELVPYF